MKCTTCNREYTIHGLKYRMCGFCGAPMLKDSERVTLGKIVRKVWVEWCLEQGITEPHKICPFDEMPPEIQEVDCRIGEAVAAFVRGKEVPR